MSIAIDFNVFYIMVFYVYEYNAEETLPLLCKESFSSQIKIKVHHHTTL